MPWKETCAVEQKNEFVHDVLAARGSKAELCRRYGISRPTGDKWLERFEELGVSGLADRSSAPHEHPNEIPQELVEIVLNVRREHRSWGPRKLRAYLERRYGRVRWPAASTMSEWLRRAGLAKRRRRVGRTPPYTQPFAGYDRANAVWCADFKGWFNTGDGRCCYPLTITDGFSRYLLRCQAMDNQRGGGVARIFELVFREHGLPEAIRTDNGSPFATRGIGGLSGLSIWWLKLGIVPERIEPGKPQQNGRHERMHLTLKQETAQPPEKTFSKQQGRFERFRTEYNTIRPHEALGQRTPSELYVPSSRPYPRRMPKVEYDTGLEVRSVQANGTICWHKRSLYVGESLRYEHVGMQALAEGTWLIYFSRMAVGVFDEPAWRVWDLDRAARRGLVDWALLRKPFRCASGLPQEGNV
jgi:transposase InsO family protein